VKVDLRVLVVVLILNLFIIGQTYSAQPESTPAQSAESKGAEICPQSDCIPAGLQFKTRKAQARWIEFEPYFGEYLGNTLHNSYVAGGRFALRVAQAMSVGAEFNYSHIYFDPAGNFGRSVTTRNQYYTDAFFTYAFPVLQRAGKTVEEADLYTTLGIGDMHINGKDRIMGLIGGGFKIYFKQKWLALRFDVNTYMYSIPKSTGSAFVDDWNFTLGPSLLFIPKKPKS
jgi:hypothetical protein